MMHGWGYSFNRMLGGGHLMMFILGLIVIGLVIYIVKNDSSGNQTLEDSPLEIAKRRYAKGEISKEEFEEIKREL
ncbi:MAG: SHOCT domain-containing protein [Bacillota bacterium]